MTEYDYSPEAYQQYMDNQQRVGDWEPYNVVAVTAVNYIHCSTSIAKQTSSPASSCGYKSSSTDSRHCVPSSHSYTKFCTLPVNYFTFPSYGIEQLVWIPDSLIAIPTNLPFQYNVPMNLIISLYLNSHNTMAPKVLSDITILFNIQAKPNLTFQFNIPMNLIISLYLHFHNTMAPKSSRSSTKDSPSTYSPASIAPSLSYSDSSPGQSSSSSPASARSYDPPYTVVYPDPKNVTVIHRQKKIPVIVPLNNGGYVIVPPKDRKIRVVNMNPEYTVYNSNAYPVQGSNNYTIQPYTQPVEASRGDHGSVLTKVLGAFSSSGSGSKSSSRRRRL
ncbi:hypothetical protein BDQ17DRAFT_1334882 [Cyathus striatus]|nr:hypothetical protein BDQ17DRAFT_1334882 [Cyathus striatus]